MLLWVKLRAKILQIVVGNVLARWHPHDVPRVVIQSVVVNVVAVATGCFGVQAVAQIPFVSQTVCQAGVAAQGVVDGFVAAREVAVQRHQRHARLQLGSSHPAAIAQHELVVGCGVDDAAIV